MAATLGVSIDATRMVATVVDTSGEVCGREQLTLGSDTPPKRVVLQVAELVQRFDASALAPAAVGIGFPGLVDHERGWIRSSTLFAGWREVRLARAIEARIGRPCIVDNDVNLAAIAELAQRDGRDAMLFVAVGAGIGGALCMGRRLWRGVSGVAGELGHVVVDPAGKLCRCGRRGCLETIASAGAIEQRAGVDPGTLALAWRAGSPRAIDAALEGARALASGIADAVHFFNPSLVVVGGSVAQLGDTWIVELRRAVAAACFVEAAAACRIEGARAGTDAAAIGGALVAAEVARYRRARDDEAVDVNRPPET